jgi:hypothetical protein
MQGVATSESTKLVAASLFDSGASVRKVAQTLDISRATAASLRHTELLDPALIHHVSRHLSTKQLLVSDGATNELLDKALNGELKNEKPIELAKIASIMAQSSVAYASVCGARDTLGALASQYGLESSHSVSKVTVTQAVSIETTSPSGREPQE